MLEELLGKVRKDGFVILEMVADKDSYLNTTFCRHFPEGMLTYCSITVFILIFVTGMGKQTTLRTM